MLIWICMPRVTDSERGCSIGMRGLLWLSWMRLDSEILNACSFVPRPKCLWDWAISWN